MKFVRCALAASITLLAACSLTSQHETSFTTVGPDYEAAGYRDGLSAYLYGDHTVLEFRDKPFALSIYDEAGNEVSYQQEGKYVRLDRELPTFKVHTLLTRAAVRLKPQSTPAAVAAPVAPVDSARSVDRELIALIAYVQTQIKELRAHLNNDAMTQAERNRLIARIESLSHAIDAATSAILQVHFDYASTNFNPDPNAAKSIVSGAIAARLVNVHGHTDSTVAGPTDSKIALGRALAAKQFLIQNGVSSSKIKVFSTPAGGFVASNETPEGRAQNRRVEIELIGLSSESDLDITEHFKKRADALTSAN